MGSFPRWSALTFVVGVSSMGLVACGGDDSGGLGSGGAGGAGGGQGGLVGSGASGGTIPSGGFGTGGTSFGGTVSTGGMGGALPTGGFATGGLVTGGAIGAGGIVATGGLVGAGGASGGQTGGGGAGEAGAAGSGGTGTGCPQQGNVSYTLGRADAPTPEQEAAYARISEAMDTAVGYYNCYTDITKELWVVFEPTVPTADGNINGSIRFGSQASMNFITATHEIAHTVGVGYYGFGDRIVNGVWTGENATRALREITGDPSAELHGDRMHFWPYGLNFTSEYESEADIIAHCTIVMAIRQDLGL